jgi:hypothetical protein
MVAPTWHPKFTENDTAKVREFISSPELIPRQTWQRDVLMQW